MRKAPVPMGMRALPNGCSQAAPMIRGQVYEFVYRSLEDPSRRLRLVAAVTFMLVKWLVLCADEGSNRAGAARKGGGIQIPQRPR